MDGRIVQIGIKISEDEIPPIPSWLKEGFPNSEDEFLSTWQEMVESEFLPRENVRVGLKYGLLEKYRNYFHFTSFDFKEIFSAFLNETTKLIEMEEIFGPSQSGEKILDLGPGSWFYIHLLKAYFEEAEKIVGVERQEVLVESAKKTLEFWGLDTDDSIVITKGDVTELDKVPEVKGEFDRITIFNALIFFSEDYGIKNDYHKLESLIRGIRNHLSENGELVITINELDIPIEENFIVSLFSQAGFSELQTTASLYESGIYEYLPPEEIPDKARVYYFEILFSFYDAFMIRRDKNIVFKAKKDNLDKLLDLLLIRR